MQFGPQVAVALAAEAGEDNATVTHILLLEMPIQEAAEEAEAKTQDVLEEAG